MYQKSLVLFALLFSCTTAGAQVIATIAGNGMAGFSGDGAAATAAELNSPMGITYSSGTLYVADRMNNVIRRIAPDGNISTIAGNGTAGYNGDNMPATAAMLNDPTGVGTDAAGNVYIADKNNNRMRKVSAAGIITTIAGTGAAGYSGDGSPAATAMLNAPRGAAADGAGNIYIADAGNQCVRKINAAGMISTIAGTGTAGYSGDGGMATAAQLYGPYNIAIDAAGNMLIADVDNERIRKINAAGIITTIAGNGTAGYSGDGGAATACSLHEALSITTNADGRVYIADAWNAAIRMINTAGIINTIAGNGTEGYSGDGAPATAAQLHNPYGVAMSDAGNLYIADYANNRVRYVMQPASAAATLSSSTAAVLQVVPNPGSKLTVNVSCQRDEDVELVITNINGDVVHKMAAKTNKLLALGDIQSGTYIISATTATAHLMQKVVVIAK